MINFEKIYCVVKTSGYHHYQSNQLSSERYERLPDAQKRVLRESHGNQLEFIDYLKRTARRLGLEINYFSDERINEINPTENDLIISCGGDGTFLSCAQHFQKNCLLGLNSDYNPVLGLGSHGALTRVKSTDLGKKLERLLNKDFEIEQWNRLHVKINGEIIPRYAVNDIFIGPRISYHTCDLTIRHQREEEFFQCSGMIASTGMGSHAWYYHAGGSPFGNELDAFAFRVLLPNKKYPLKFTSAVVSNKHKLTVIPNRENYILSFDSKDDVIKVNMGDEISVCSSSKKPVKVITFPKTEF